MDKGNFLDNIISKSDDGILLRISVILTSVSIVLTLISIILTASKDFEVYLSLIILVIASAMLILAIIILFWKRRILFYRDRDNLPKKYKVASILRQIGRNKYNMIIAGRTNIRWFENVEDLKKLYENALKKGCRIKFIIQRYDIKNIGLIDNEEIQKEIFKDHKTVISAFKKIHEYLKENACSSVSENFKMVLTQHPVNNSISYISEINGLHVQLSYDIGLNIPKKQNPVLIFRKISVLPELFDQLKDLENNSIDLYDYERKFNEGKSEINNILQKYLYFSEQRNNPNKKLIYYYYKRREYLNGENFYPPISIQLLVTNKCTTQCIMCNHHSIDSGPELALPEIEKTFDYICDLGTKNIIISGGEPLHRNDCFEILEKAKSKNLNIGLLTNGIKLGNKNITIEDAKIIKDTCDWVQLSVDSFMAETYKKIRGIDIEHVKQSLDNLEKIGINIEIAFTLQKENIDEAIQIIKTEKNGFHTYKYIRFKFAHGVDKDNSFLLPESKIMEFLQNCKPSDKFNTEYISKMISDDNFHVTDIADGMPLRSLNNVFKNKRYTCHVLNYSCKIDAIGDIYPCCFLYDDNMGKDSAIREKYNMGSLRKGSSNQIPAFDGSNNILKNILFEKITSYKKDIIPVNERACNHCTRHFYQNAFLNEIDRVTEKYKEINFIYQNSEEGNSCENIWL